MANNTTNGTGLPPPTMQGRTGSPAQAAYNDRHQQNTQQAELIKRTSGGSKKKKEVLLQSLRYNQCIKR